MTLLTLLLILIGTGIVLFLINRFLPIDGKVGELINYLVIIILVLLVIFFFLDAVGVMKNPIKL